MNMIAILLFKLVQKVNALKYLMNIIFIIIYGVKCRLRLNGLLKYETNCKHDT